MRNSARVSGGGTDVSGAFVAPPAAPLPPRPGRGCWRSTRKPGRPRPTPRATCQAQSRRRATHQQRKLPALGSQEQERGGTRRRTKKALTLPTRQTDHHHTTKPSIRVDAWASHAKRALVPGDQTYVRQTRPRQSAKRKATTMTTTKMDEDKLKPTGVESFRTLQFPSAALASLFFCAQPIA